MLTRIPDQSLIVSGQGEGVHHVQATRDEAGSYAFLYIPTGAPVTVDLDRLSGETLVACWYDPRTGVSSAIGTVRRAGRREFVPVTRGQGRDWILVLDDRARGYGPPGVK